MLPASAPLQPSKRAALRATAYHEAGHAVAGIIRRVRFDYVTIEPDEADGSAGHVLFTGRRRSTPAALHDRAVVALVGEAAQRQFSPSSVRQHHVRGDRAAVVDAALQTTGSTEQANLLVKFWTVVARDLVASRWDVVNRVAAGLLLFERMSYAEVLDRMVTRPGPAASRA